jgi:hypothetical protein
MSGKKGAESQSRGFEPALAGIENELLPEIRDYGRDFDRGQGLYSGSILGPEHELVNQGNQTALDQIPGMQDHLSLLRQTNQGFLDYDPNSFQNQASRDALGANVQAQFNESIRPGIEDRGTFSGQFGGSQVGNALGAATAPLSRAIGDSEVGLMNADRNRALAASQQTGGILRDSLLPSQIQSDIGNQRTQRGQQERMDFIQQQEAERRNRFQSLQEQSSLYGPLAGAGGTATTTPGSAGAGGVLSGALGGAVAGGQLGGMSGTPFGAGVGAAGGAIVGGLGALI